MGPLKDKGGEGMFCRKGGMKKGRCDSDGCLRDVY